MDDKGLIASSLCRKAITPPPENTLEVFKESLSRYHHLEASHDGEGGEEGAAHTARMASVDGEPIFKLETPNSTLQLCPLLKLLLSMTMCPISPSICQSITAMALFCLLIPSCSLR
jgi:hypothetical protein